MCVRSLTILPTGTPSTMGVKRRVLGLTRLAAMPRLVGAGGELYVHSLADHRLTLCGTQTPHSMDDLELCKHAIIIPMAWTPPSVQHAKTYMIKS